MTGYKMQVGYMSGYSGDWQGDSAWQEMKKVALDLCEHPERIAAEAIEYGCPQTDGDGDDVFNYAENYRTRKDLTIRFHEDDEIARDNEQPCIRQAASGGGASRTIKEHLRRAFCRLMIQEMHRRGIEVVLFVG